MIAEKNKRENIEKKIVNQRRMISEKRNYRVCGESFLGVCMCRACN